MPHLSKPVQGIFFDLGWTLLTPVTGDWMFSSLARQYFPLEKMARGNKDLSLIRLNLNEAVVPAGLNERAVGINCDMAEAVSDLCDITRSEEGKSL